MRCASSTKTAAGLKAGDAVAVFPEGTTGPGPGCCPSTRTCCKRPVSVEAPVLPVLLRWHEPGQRFSTGSVCGRHDAGAELVEGGDGAGLGVVVSVLPSQRIRGQERRALAQTLETKPTDALAASQSGTTKATAAR